MASPMSCPAITLLKPLKGAERDTKKCLRSWFLQDYPAPVQILFGVASPEDPVCAIVHELIAEFPEIDAQLVICYQPLSVNRKVSTLIQLEPKIRHDFIVVSDADVSVSPDLLKNIAPLLTNPKVGLVNCFYRAANPSTLAMQWEALAVNSDFWSQVLQAKSLKEVDFAMGAVMALPLKRLKNIGGFNALSSFLADDYQLGHQIAHSGGKVVISPVVVDCWETAVTWKQTWSHQLRWARTVRACQPLPYFFSILSNATLWPCLWLLYWVPLGFPNARFPVLAICANALVFRILSSIDMQRRMTQSSACLFYWWLVPIKDLLNVAIWALSFLGSHIEWRGEIYQVTRGGKLVRRESGETGR